MKYEKWIVFLCGYHTTKIYKVLSVDAVYHYKLLYYTWFTSERWWFPSTFLRKLWVFFQRLNGKIVDLPDDISILSWLYPIYIPFLHLFPSLFWITVIPPSWAASSTRLDARQAEAQGHGLGIQAAANADAHHVALLHLGGPGISKVEAVRIHVYIYIYICIYIYM